MSNAAPGWYPQPDGSQRWWDGYQWTDYATVTTQPPKRKLGWIIALSICGGLLIVVGIGASVIAAGRTPKSPAIDVAPSTATLDHDLALAACENTVEKQLKSGHADHFDHEAAAMVNATTWTASGVVYATNSFGAVVPAAFRCTVTASGSDTYTTHIDELTNLG